MPAKNASLELPIRVTRLGYRPELDGLRGLAILLVIVGHATPWLPGGWLGVDLFFVLSGFLITTLLLEEWATTSSISLRSFYARRALRLLPALFAFLAAYGIVVLLLAEKSVMFRTRGALAVVGYFSNWVIAFRPMEFPRELAHLWSLSVEEQFYLVWPFLVVLVLMRGGSHRSVRRMLVAFIAAVALWRGVLIMRGAGEIRLYFGTDVRIDELFLGCLLAVAFNRTGLVATPVAAGTAGLAFLLLMSVFDPLPDVWWSFAVGIPAIAVAAAALLGTVLSPRDSVLKRLLSHRSIVFLGLISYPVYLWHTPINALATFQLEMTGPLRYSAVVAASVVAGVGSYYLIESPFLRMRKRFQRIPSATKAAVEPTLAESPVVPLRSPIPALLDGTIDAGPRTRSDEVDR